MKGSEVLGREWAGGRKNACGQAPQEAVLEFDLKWQSHG